MHLPLKRIILNTERLIRKSRQGNLKAQKALYEKYVGLLYSVVFRYLKNESDAEDILLQSFQKIFQKIDDFQYVNDNAFVGWIKKITINEALMFLRKDFRLVYKTEQLDVLNESTIKVAPEMMEEQDLIKLVEQLPQGYKMVFLLNVVDGYSHKEIAENLKIAESTSRSQLLKARNLLQKKLGDYYGNAMGT